jgi:hypothetical protein
MNDRTVKLKKDDLLSKLKQNKADHVEAFEEASKKWADDMKQASINIARTPTDEDALEKLSSVWRSKPKSYEEEYDLAIAQMDMEIRTEIELSLHEFNQLVCDKWSWMTHFASNVYSSASMTSVKSKRGK